MVKFTTGLMVVDCQVQMIVLVCKRDYKKESSTC